MEPKLGILIVDDNDVFRHHASLFLERQNVFEIAGTAATAADGARLFEQLQPDIVLLDISLPDRSGFELIEAMKEIRPKARIILITSHDEEEYRIRAQEKGADGYIVKRRMARDLLRVIASLQL